jgi:hypothetical protein
MYKKCNSREPSLDTPGTAATEKTRPRDGESPGPRNSGSPLKEPHVVAVAPVGAR